ncbi:WXG100 family type VII secretion target [Nocardia pseudobrasiliensis]|uniref:ESAT-6-like protein n=1 Tax=Nocardia pseudobrasiliensis TaxID=45979 RepID=A0A370I327_9NOCA|nr:WXG100 family type VII secretion target [Nocardia pseudobrasiliensis]RDI64551.1 WXG100 family type VII secretion target [Nocardia pseudobrasiliensis]
MSDSGGSPELVVVPDDVQAVGQYVYNIADTMKQALDSAAREVDSLLTSGWTGDAADEFGTGWSETHDGGSQLMQALTSLAEKLGVTAANYRKTDSDSAESVGTLDMS